MDITAEAVRHSRVTTKVLRHLKKNSLIRPLPRRQQSNITRCFIYNSIKSYTFFLEKDPREGKVCVVRRYKNADMLLNQLVKLRASLEKGAKKATRLKVLGGFTKVLGKVSSLIDKLKESRREA